MNKKDKVAIFLAPGYEMAEVIITIDLLRRAAIPVDIISVSDQLSVKSQHDIIILASFLINKYDFTNCKAIILPGGLTGVINLMQNQILNQVLLMFANDKTKLIGAICAAPQILGVLGLLDNKKITFYPGIENGLEKAIKTTEKVVVCENIITAKSVGCTFDFALKIVEILRGAAASKAVATKLEF